MSTGITPTSKTTLSKVSHTLLRSVSFVKTKVYGATLVASTARSAVSSLPSLPILVKTPTKNEPPLRETSKEQVYELSTVNDSGIYLPPSLDAINLKRDHWHVRQSSDESFPSTDRLIMRCSLSDSNPVLDFYTPSLPGSRPPSLSLRAQVTWDGIANQQKELNAGLPIEPRPVRPSSPESDEDDETVPPSLSGSVSSSTMSDPLSVLAMEDDDIKSSLSLPKTMEAGQKTVRAVVPNFEWDNLVQA